MALAGGSRPPPKVPGFVNQALIGFQAAELEIARRASLPFGLSILAAARKPVPVRVSMAVPEEARAVPVAGAGPTD